MTGGQGDGQVVGANQVASLSGTDTPPDSLDATVEGNSTNVIVVGMDALPNIVEAIAKERAYLANHTRAAQVIPELVKSAENSLAMLLHANFGSDGNITFDGKVQPIPGYLVMGMLETNAKSDISNTDIGKHLGGYGSQLVKPDELMLLFPESAVIISRFGSTASPAIANPYLTLLALPPETRPFFAGMLAKDPAVNGFVTNQRSMDANMILEVIGMFSSGAILQYAASAGVTEVRPYFEAVRLLTNSFGGLK